MTIDEKIRITLLPFGDPVENGIYQGTAKQYYTFNYNSMGVDFCDDAPEYDRCMIQVHFFAPLNVNVVERITETKQALFDAGFTWAIVENATDENSRHYVFEVEIAGGTDGKA